VVSIGKNVIIGNEVYTNSIVFKKRKELAHKKLKVGFTCGAFDILHAGHVLMLKEAKNVCDYLVVGVQSDPSIDRSEKNAPIQSYEERIITTKAIRYVDEILLYDTESDLIELLKNLNPDVRILGSDWEGKHYTGYELPIESHFNKRDHSWSSSSLRRRIFIAELSPNEPYEMT